MTPPIDGMKTIPYGEDYMMPAWSACVSHAIGKEEVLTAFKAESGIDLKVLVGTSPIERMVDDATGRTKDMMVAFADWVTSNIWGIEGQEGDE